MTETAPSSQPSRTERNMRGIALLLLVIGCLVVLWPFLSAILWAVVLTFTAWPIYSRLLVIMGGRRTWASLLMTIGTTLILLVPFLVVGFTLADDVRALTSGVREFMEAGPPDAPGWLRRVPLVGNAAADYWQ